MMRRRPLLAGAIAFAVFIAAVLAVSFLGSGAARAPGGVELAIQLAVIAVAIAVVVGAVRRRG